MLFPSRLFIKAHKNRYQITIKQNQNDRLKMDYIIIEPLDLSIIDTRTLYTRAAETLDLSIIDIRTLYTGAAGGLKTYKTRTFKI